MSEQARHTDGPWHVSDCEHNDSDEITPERPSVLSGSWHICRIDDACPSPMENARLIAAAPELLEACRLLLQDEFSEDGMVIANCDIARAAIAKATGGAQ